jgi:hypothetical protein
MSAALCITCQTFFVGKFMDIPNEPCPHCGQPLGRATPGEVRSFVAGWKAPGLRPRTGGRTRKLGTGTR